MQDSHQKLRPADKSEKCVDCCIQQSAWLSQFMKRKGGFELTAPEGRKVVTAFLSEIDG